jgi:hypothetical protein
MVRARKRDLKLGKRSLRTIGCRRGRPTVVVVGGGVAGHSAIETLRLVVFSLPSFYNFVCSP